MPRALNREFSLLRCRYDTHIWSTKAQLQILHNKYLELELTILLRTRLSVRKRPIHRMKTSLDVLGRLGPVNVELDGSALHGLRFHTGMLALAAGQRCQSTVGNILLKLPLPLLQQRKCKPSFARLVKYGARARMGRGSTLMKECVVNASDATLARVNSYSTSAVARVAIWWRHMPSWIIVLWNEAVGKTCHT